MDIFIEWAYQAYNNALAVLDAIAVGRSCKVCSAAPGERCIEWDDGKFRSYPHSARGL